MYFFHMYIYRDCTNVQWWTTSFVIFVDTRVIYYGIMIIVINTCLVGSEKWWCRIVGTLIVDYSSFVLSNRILPFVYTFSCMFVELLNLIQSAGMCRYVQVMGIVTYAWWFQEPDHTPMLYLRWSTSISYSAPWYMLH